tara:strand:+ start:235 stop:501 length:267 start_codon:yes stop_codon:yes gene_type:complete
MTIIKTAASSTPTLTVNTNDEKEQWVQILTAAANYHWDMSGQFEPDIKTSDESSDMEKVAKVHRGWARAIQEATQLIRFWDAEKDEEE